MQFCNRQPVFFGGESGLLKFKVRRHQLNRRGFHERSTVEKDGSTDHVFEDPHGARKIVKTDVHDVEILKEYT